MSDERCKEAPDGVHEFWIKCPQVVELSIDKKSILVTECVYCGTESELIVSEIDVSNWVGIHGVTN